MRKILILAVGIVLALPALARDVEIGSFDPSQLHISGSQCTFERKPRATILVSDWAGKFWMNVNGKMVELVSHKTDDELEQQLAKKRWYETLSDFGLTVELSLVELGRGQDSAMYKGYVEVKRRGSTMRIPITGGCGA